MLRALRDMKNSVQSFWEREPVIVLAVLFGFTGKPPYTFVLKH